MNEPQRGQLVYGRFKEHHIAGMLWHRDDREGHDNGRVWWSHSDKEWQDWTHVELAAQVHNLVLVPLMPAGYVAEFGHGPDGACHEGCPSAPEESRA